MKHTIYSFPETSENKFYLLKELICHLKDAIIGKSTSVYIIGSNVKNINKREPEINGDVDVVVITPTDFVKGKPIIDTKSICNMLEDSGFGFSYNGIPVFSKNINIDLIPVMTSEIDNLHPQIIFDLLNNDIIHLHGNNILEPIMNEVPSKQDLINRIEITLNYIKRECVGYDNIDFWKRYLLKSIYFIADLSSLNHCHPRNKTNWSSVLIHFFGSSPDVNWEFSDLDEGLAQLHNLKNWVIETVNHNNWPNNIIHADPKGLCL